MTQNRNKRCTQCQYCTIAFDTVNEHIVCNVASPAYIVRDTEAIRCTYFKKISKDQLGHRCHSCDTLVDNIANYCYGCKKLVCDICAFKYEHYLNGTHGKLSKTKRRKRR